MQACVTRLQELTKIAPVEPKDWALDDELECYPQNRPSAAAADGMCMNCFQLQAFLKDGARNIFTATLSEAEAQHFNL